MNRRDSPRTSGGASGGATPTEAVTRSASGEEVATRTSGPGTTDGDEKSVSRRAFVGAVAGGSALGAAGTAAAQEEDEQTTTEGDGTGDGEGEGGGTTTGGEGEGQGDGEGEGGGGGGSEEVVVGPGGELVYEPADLTVAPGTTVNFVWESDNHNVVPDSIPDDAQWEGTPGAPEETYDTGNDYSHTFDVEGTYDYFCQPHVGAGMEASITVQQGGGGVEELDPDEMGVPFQAHYVGTATMLAIVVSLVFTFYLLKYGESPNASSPNRD